MRFPQSAGERPHSSAQLATVSIPSFYDAESQMWAEGHYIPGLLQTILLIRKWNKKPLFLYKITGFFLNKQKYI